MPRTARLAIVVAMSAMLTGATNPDALHRARHLTAEHRLRAASEVLRHALRASPDSTELWVELANVARMRGRSASSIHAWRAAVEHGYANPDALEAMAVALARNGNGRKADAIFQRRTREFPAPLAASELAWWGVALETLGRRQDAARLYERAINVEPQHTFGRASLGALLAREETTRGRGLQLLASALRSAGAPDADLLFALGRGYGSVGETSLALDLLRRAHGAATETTLRERIDAHLQTLTANLKRPPAPPDAPNVVLIVIDTMRADHLGCYGYARATSPTIDALAASGAMFLRASSQAPWTAPSIASLLTGVYPSVHGLDGGIEWTNATEGNALPFMAQRTLTLGISTLASVLRAHGFHTAGFVSNVYVNAIFGFGSGFDVYVDDHADYSRDVLGRKRRGDVTLAEVVRWLDSKPEEPFLLFVHLNDPHWPYEPPKPYGEEWTAGYRGPIVPADTAFVVENVGKPARALTLADVEYLKALYDGEIAYADAVVAALGQRLAAARLTRPMITVLTADHGEEFLEHGSTSHGYSLFEEQTHVPLIVRDPRGTPAVRVDLPVELVDVMPTILDLCRVDAPEGLQGRSLVPLVRGDRESSRPTYSEAPLRGHLRAIRDASGHKLIRDDDRNQTRTYDLATDPGELSGTSPSTNALEQLLDKWSGDNRNARRRLSAGGATALATPVGDTTRRRLEALGYLEPGAR